MIDVILKFAKLHDGFDFEDMDQIHSYFENVLILDFLKYHSRPQPLLQETLDGMIKAYNETPENFESPAESTVNEMIRLVEEQMALDEKNDLIESMSSIKSEISKTHGSFIKWHSPSPQKTAPVNHS